jgi:CRP-like cAMP-binding protein
MSTALEEVSRTLQLDGDQRAREVIAVRIIELARRGERDPERLRDRVLQEADASGCEGNPLLAQLSPASSSFLYKHFREHTYKEGTVLWAAGASLNQVFFPVSGFIGIRVPSKGGGEVEIASVGPEGAAGMHEATGMLPVFTEGIMQAAGRVLAISAQAFAVAARQSDEIRRLAELCIEWLLLQSQLLAACNAVHSADARFCRWLLRVSDMLGADIVPATQEAIAQDLGIRRTTATLIAQHLHSRGIISYKRGRITIQDRAGLEAAACHCYRMLGRDCWPSELLRARPTRSTTA